MDEILALQLLHLLGIEAHSILERPESLPYGAFRVFYDFFSNSHWLERDVELHPKPRNGSPIWGQLVPGIYYERYARDNLLPPDLFASRLTLYDKYAGMPNGTSRKFWQRHSRFSDGIGLASSLSLKRLVIAYPKIGGNIVLLEQQILIPAWKELGFEFGSAADAWRIA